MLNTPAFDTTDISFGPAVLYVGVTGATPTLDVGAIAEDGVSFSVERENRVISQGSPRIPMFTFDQAHSVKVMVKSIEWDFTKLALGFGSGVTSTVSGNERYEFGGSPFPREVALRVIHRMPVSLHTLDIKVWRAQASGNYEMNFGQNEHEHSYEWTTLLGTTDWAGATLSDSARLIRIDRIV